MPLSRPTVSQQAGVVTFSEAAGAWVFKYRRSRSEGRCPCVVDEHHGRPHVAKAARSEGGNVSKEATAGSKDARRTQSSRWAR